VKIQQDAAVSVRLALADETGWSAPAQELTYLHGHGNLFPKLEAALAGLEAGGNASVKLAPADAFGERDPALVLQARREHLPPDVALGSQLRASGRGDDAQPQVFRVVELNDTDATLDGNHPLAGRTVEMSVAVLEVRGATEEELAHGHVHGPGDDHSH
jgi:FKBP-type peptidyl-prolyl cis-trans isomerase SlyD